MAQIVAWILMTIGSLFMFLAAVGLVRMPDLFLRMHAITKSSTLGIGLLAIGSALYFGELAIATRAMAVMLFIYITVPVGAHMIARSAYFAGVPLWEGTLSDELRGHYDLKTHALTSTTTDESALHPPDGMR